MEKSSSSKIVKGFNPQSTCYQSCSYRENMCQKKHTINGNLNKHFKNFCKNSKIVCEGACVDYQNLDYNLQTYFKKWVI